MVVTLYFLFFLESKRFLESQQNISRGVFLVLIERLEWSWPPPSQQTPASTTTPSPPPPSPLPRVSSTTSTRNHSNQSEEGNDTVSVLRESWTVESKSPCLVLCSQLFASLLSVWNQSISWAALLAFLLSFSFKAKKERLLALVVFLLAQVLSLVISSSLFNGKPSKKLPP